MRWISSWGDSYDPEFRLSSDAKVLMMRSGEEGCGSRSLPGSHQGHHERTEGHPLRADYQRAKSDRRMELLPEEGVLQDRPVPEGEDASQEGLHPAHAGQGVDPGEPCC